MQDLLKALAIPMTPFEAYGRTHLLIVCGAVACAFLSAVILSGRNQRDDMNIFITRDEHPCTDRVLFVSGLLMALMEILKQLLLTYVRGGSYSWSDFPFQLCSVPMYLCLVYPFFQEGSRIKGAIRQFLMTFGLIGAVAAFAVPYSSFYSYVLLTAQSLLWHEILLFIALFLILSERQGQGRKNRGNKRRNGQRSGRSFLPFGAMGLYLAAAFLAVILNAALYRVSSGSANMFFFGPGRPDMFILNSIYEKYGWIAETAAMAAASESAAVLVWNLISLLF